MQAVKKTGGSPFSWMKTIEVLFETGIQPIKGYKYTLNKEGRLLRKGRYKYQRCPTCDKLSAIALDVEEVDLSHLKLPEGVYPVKRESGYFYYVNKKGELVKAILYKRTKTGRILSSIGWTKFSKYRKERRDSLHKIKKSGKETYRSFIGAEINKEMMDATIIELDNLIKMTSEGEGAREKIAQKAAIIKGIFLSHMEERKSDAGFDKNKIVKYFREFLKAYESCWKSNF